MSLKSEIEEEYLEELEQKYEKTGYIASDEWHKFNRLQQHYKPEKYKKRRERETNEFNMQRARELPLEILMKVLIEKDPSLSIVTKNKVRSTTKKKVK